MPTNEPTLNMTTPRAETVYGRVMQIEQFGHFVGRMEGQLDRVIAAVQSESEYNENIDTVGKRLHSYPSVLQTRRFLAMLETAEREGVICAEDALRWREPLEQRLAAVLTAIRELQFAAQAVRTTLEASGERYAAYIRQIEEAINAVMGTRPQD